MSQIFNIYCDESCYLEKDPHKAMVLGAVCCPLEEVRRIARDLRQIKLRHQLSPGFEIKWTKISPAKVQFYLDVMEYFFDEIDLHFRAIVIADKSQLQPGSNGLSYNESRSQVYLNLLRGLLKPKERYRIYLDFKDTRGGEKVELLQNTLSNSLLDFSREIVERIQVVRSREVELLQLTDLLVGTVSYANRGLSGKAKQALVERMRQRSGYKLVRNTLALEDKLNLFFWPSSVVLA